MKVALAILLSLTLFPALTPLAQRRDPVTVKSKLLALVIGNAAYKESPLSNPVNDARDMSQLLTELGFQVIYLNPPKNTPSIAPAWMEMTGIVGASPTINVCYNPLSSLKLELGRSGRKSAG
jgi:hypothetical protein